MAPRGAKIIYEVSLKPDRSAALAAQSMPALYGRARGLPDGRNAVVSVPNLRSKAPTHHQVFWLMQPGAAEDLPKRPARLPAFSWTPAHNGRLSAQSRAAANTATG